ncbi:MAG: carbohydrate kinase family protein [Deferribacteres bacterium]|nr:carbohydrate kinase family protein [candidate division KSB1 bacterium]MCB9502244.1 carbohydrate kinase family protein [Deferribacteres bacterium]
MSKIAFVSTFIRDEIIPLQGHPTQSIGGLYHGLAYAAFLAGEDTELYPVATVGEDFQDILLPRLGKLPRLNLEMLHFISQKNTAVRLKYISETERDEFTTAPMPPISGDRLIQLADFDAVLFNMVSGEELELETLQHFQHNANCLVYLDFHTLALARDTEGKRYPNCPENWQDWIRCVDYVQMNEKEAAILSGDDIRKDDVKAREFLQRLLGLGVRGVLITLGDKGVLAGLRQNNGANEIQFFENPKSQSPVVDIIGCGDAFGAVFLLNFVKYQNFWQAIKKAMLIATFNTTFLGSITKEIFKEKIQPYA